MTQRDYIKEEQEQLDSDRRAGVEGLPPIGKKKMCPIGFHSNGSVKCNCDQKS